MLKRLHVALVLAVLLFSALIGVQFVDLTLANPYQPPMPETPDTSEPSISIQSPEYNKIYNVNTVPSSFSVKKPPSWFEYYPVHGTLMSVSYILDGRQEVTIADDDPDFYTQTFSFNGTLSGLSEGNHSIVVYVRSDSFYDPSNRPQPPYGQLPPLDYYLDTYSDKVYFAIDTTPPSISVLSVENKTYDTVDVPLNFTVSEPISRISYCLDNQANVTIAGNTTLTELSEGQHSLIVYAKDAAGNTGTSETIYFSIKTQQSEPFPITWIVAATAVIAIGVAITLGVVIYRRKRLTSSKTP